MIAIFDDDGACLSVGERDMVGPGVRVEVPRGSRPNDIWFDGESVRASDPATLELPQFIDAEGGFASIPLPDHVVADVNGERHRGTLVLDPDKAEVMTIVVRGAQYGVFAVRVRDYAARRRTEYPPVGDQLDAIWKWLAGQEKTPATDAMLAQVQAVKDAIPKSYPTD